MLTPVRYRVPLLALLALILANLACTAPGSTVVKGDVTCTYKPWHIIQPYECTCPLDGYYDRFGSSALQTISDAELYRSVCEMALASGGPLPSRTPTATALPPTQTATSTKTSTPRPPTETPVPLQPYLTGGFTTCDNVAGYVNFSIAADAPAYDPATFKVLFDGQEARCTPATNNSTVFTCSFPPRYRAPATIEVLIGGRSVNKFEFPGGAICDPAPQPPSNSGGDQPAVEPSPTDPSTD